MMKKKQPEPPSRRGPPPCLMFAARGTLPLMRCQTVLMSARKIPRLGKIHHLNRQLISTRKCRKKLMPQFQETDLKRRVCRQEGRKVQCLPVWAVLSETVPRLGPELMALMAHLFLLHMVIVQSLTLQQAVQNTLLVI